MPLRKLFIIIFTFTITSSAAMAQTRFYRGNSSYTSDILMTFDGAVPLPILMLML